MSNDSKNTCPVEPMAAPVRRPVSRGEIDRLFKGVRTCHITYGQLDIEPSQVRAYGPYVQQVQEMDEYVLDFIRALRETYTSLHRRSFEPLCSVRNIDRKGE